ncbi:MAG: diguanylate cyclase [Frankiales bacterium]|nr:diguanylate cyclase [Frankiales bacterium]
MAALCAVLAGTAGLAAAAPVSEDAPFTLTAFIAVAALALLATVWWAPQDGWLHVASLAAIAAVTSIVACAATPQGTVGVSVVYGWVPVYSAFYFSRRTTRLYVALISVAFAAGLACNPFSGAPKLWLLIAFTITATAEAVAVQAAQLARQAVTDPLTGLLNRDGLRVQGQREVAVAQREGKPLTVVVIDLDGFKLVNDRGGHAAGDQLLLDIVQSWRTSLRANDLLARHGGDEFVLVLPRTDRPAAEKLMARLLLHSPAEWSSGIATAHAGETLEAVLDRADREMYRTKNRRREAHVG